MKSRQGEAAGESLARELRGDKNNDDDDEIQIEKPFKKEGPRSLSLGADMDVLKKAGGSGKAVTEEDGTSDF